MKRSNPADTSRAIHERRALWPGSCALNSTAQSAGLKVSDTKQEISVEAAIVTANWRKNCPVMPDRNADGTNTAHSVSAIEISAPPTSRMVTWAASAGLHASLEIALDILHHDDGVVDHDADRKHETEQRQIVQRNAERHRGR